AGAGARQGVEQALADVEELGVVEGADDRDGDDLGPDAQHRPGQPEDLRLLALDLVDPLLQGGGAALEHGGPLGGEPALVLALADGEALEHAADVVGEAAGDREVPRREGGAPRVYADEDRGVAGG